MISRRRSQLLSFVLLLTLAPTVTAHAQAIRKDLSVAASASRPSPANHRGRATDDPLPATAEPGPLFKNILYDQKTIWTSPFKARIQDLNWIVPIVGLTAGMINADAELSSRIDTTGTFARHGGAISNAGLAAAVASGGGLYLLGKVRSDDHETETGIVAGEAAVNSVIVTEVIKLIARRNRPTDDSGKGEFFQNGSILNSSFPSLHSIVTWSIASAVSHEYPGPLTQTFSYGLATGVSLARVYGRDHFPSDVIAGAAMGWLIGRQVYASHHRPDLPGGDYGTFHSSTEGEAPSANSQFSPYVPLDSWVYPAMDRLAALGVINSDFKGLRPWTRAECARLLEEAESSIDEDSGDEGSRLYAALAKEFATELNGEWENYVSLDSIYSRITAISGTPLTDGYHFGQTIVNDFGRPFQSGGNGLAGFSASGSSGALGFYIRGEYEHAPSAPGVSQSVQDAIQIADAKPLGVPAQPIPAFNQFRLLDTYLTLNIKGWQTSFGKQSLWLAPVQDPFLQSDNAEPMYMLRVDQTMPSVLPSILKYLGPYRVEFWVGKLTGQHFISTQGPLGTVVSLGRSIDKQPMVNGTKVNFKPTPNFEFGVGRTGLFGGPDFPITLGSLRHVLFSTTNAAGRGHDPGDRRSTFDFSYRLPGMRNWLTLYEDSFVEDEISPIGYPRRAAHEPGLYMSHVPGLPHLDMRVEAAYTNLPGLIQPPGGGFFYWNTRYLDGYTNQGNIIGDATVGRQGISLRANSTYWVASDKTVQFGYRSNIADSAFLGGGNLRDFFLHSEWSFSRHVSLSSFLQYEYWNFPLLSAGKKQNDFTASFQLTYWPHWRLKGGR
ncbi:MAG TPA: capsule assembly Wzi family protein [Candidatus Angelobacter sp.]|nr:capsule assembly Wzi family protein [Candidatus Angelobacter sp.]